MTTKPRAPMKFTLDAPPAATAKPPAPPAADPEAERQQVGARVTKATYRKLKAVAALRGETVQALVEQAIDDFLTKQASELVTKLS